MKSEENVMKRDSCKLSSILIIFVGTFWGTHFILRKEVYRIKLSFVKVKHFGNLEIIIMSAYDDDDYINDGYKDFFSCVSEVWNPTTTHMNGFEDN